MNRSGNDLSRPTAVLVGMGANGLGVARALARHQIPSIALAPHWEPACATRYCRTRLSMGWSGEAVVEGLRKIGRELERKAILMITSDDAVPWISEAREALAEFYEINLPGKETVRVLFNKGEFLDLARKEGWPIPLSWEVQSREALLSLIGEFKYPCILKPKIKNRAFSERYLPHKAFKAASPGDLIRLYDEIGQYEKEVVIQEWIAGGDEQIAFSLTYYSRAGKPLTFFTGRKLRQWPIRSGSTAISEPAPDGWHDALTSLTEKIWRTVGFKGFGSIEYKIDESGQRPVIIEPTVGRTNYLSELAVINGENIPAIGYFDLAGLKYPRPASKPAPIKLIHGEDDFRAALAYFRSGELTIPHWIESRRGKKKYVFFRMDDAGPFFAALPSVFRSLLSKGAEWVLGKRLKARLKKLFPGRH